MSFLRAQADHTRAEFERFAADPRVRWWLKRNPPPRGWKWGGARWALLEMPIFWFVLPASLFEQEQKGGAA